MKKEVKKMSVLSCLEEYAPITIKIKGEVAFSHISHKYEGKELEEINKKAIKNGGIAIDKPYSSITIANPVILEKELLPEKIIQIINKRFKKDKNGVFKYYAISKLTNLPNVTYSDEAGTNLKGSVLADEKKNIYLRKELDTGLSITIGVKIYKSNKGVGLGIDYILLNEEVRYYESNNLLQQLEEQGIIQSSADKIKKNAFENTELNIFEIAEQNEQSTTSMKKMSSVSECRIQNTKNIQVNNDMRNIVPMDGINIYKQYLNNCNREQLLLEYEVK